MCIVCFFLLYMDDELNLTERFSERNAYIVSTSDTQEKKKKNRREIKIIRMNQSIYKF